jgi:hypothetical protein
MGNASTANELSSRPERSEVEGPAVHSTGLQLARKPRLFIGSAAEGSAVLRTIRESFSVERSVVERG